MAVPPRASWTATAQRFNVQTVLGQVGYRVSDSTSVSGGAGVAHLDVSSTDFSNWGPSFHAGLDHRVDRTTLNVRYSKTFVPSFSFGGLAGNQDFSAGAQMPITRSGRLLLNGSVVLLAAPSRSWSSVSATASTRGGRT